MEALSIYHVVAEDALQLLHFRLQIDHDFGGLGDLLQAQLFLAPDVFVEDLEEKLCYESLHVLLVRMLGIDPFNVHLADISFILFAELVHPADQLIPLVGQITHLVIEGNLMLPVLYLVVAQVLQLTLQVANALARRLVVFLEPFQIVRLPQQIGVHAVSLPLNLRRELFLLPQFLDKGVFLSFKSVKLVPQLHVQVSLVLEVVLKVAIDHVFQTRDLVELAFELFC
mmetsp:Transcript_6909/g.8265  ORF Transcript_6909/g.8265 Transcript_6909/m.8265 type:complete len:227 (+) Transcript_6909:4054-4734(+)